MKETDSLSDILDEIGVFGKLQILAFSLVCLNVLFNSAAHVAYVFTTLETDYRCLVPQCEESSPGYNSWWVSNAIPFDSDDNPERCSMYLPLNSSSASNCTANAFDRNHTVKCSSYFFKNDEHYLGREFNLLCSDNKWKLTLVGTLNTIGMFFGLLITGVISDKYGRKFVLLVGISTCGVVGVIKAFSPTFEWFCFFEFLEAVLAAGSYGCGFILGVELVTPKLRVLTGCISCCCYALGEVLIAAVSWAVMDWRMILYLVYGPSILVIFMWWSIPESIRWYLSKGRIEEPKRILRSFAEANGKQISEESLDKLKLILKEQQELHESVTFVDLLKSTPLFLRFLNCSFCWITCAFLFYGMTLNSVTLSSNSYLDFIYISLTEIPAYCSAVFIADRIGRRYSMALSYGLTAVSCFAFIFVSKDIVWLRIIIYCMGKFGATSAFILIYVVASEIFPTSLRHTMMGVCSMVGRFGSVASPQIPLLGDIWKPLPLLLFTSLAAVSAFTSLFFPETLNMKLPDTIKEAERIGKNSTDNNK
ncbi:solute carrier family 22 member 1-like isoform X2 [Harmonia axyridis]|uniref:solute carrier family 22 member 1-like isoform X2 n=1 Tax=Harmonia axyridis TaxID=115357 RepID=UPI001E2750B1|nr:solute carrier family 22 member 1-like isoform X2 [Harmonia axyridis]